MSDDEDDSVTAFEEERAPLQTELEALRAGAAAEPDAAGRDQLPASSDASQIFLRYSTLTAAKVAAIQLAERQFYGEGDENTPFHVPSAGAQVLGTNPNDPDAWISKGDSLERAGRLEEALAAYETALEIDPKKIVSWQCMGSVLEDLRRFEIALEAYDRVLELDPDDEFGLCRKGEMLQQLGQYEESLSACERLLAIYPDHPIALYNKGVALEKLGRAQEAVGTFSTLAGVEPDGEDSGGGIIEDFHFLSWVVPRKRWPHTTGR